MVVNIHNVFSPNVHVTFTQLLAELETLPFLTSERLAAKEQLQELEAQTKGSKRWGVIGRHLDSIKTLGKGVYEKVALPLVVEFLKGQMKSGSTPM